MWKKKMCILNFFFVGSTKKMIQSIKYIPNFRCFLCIESKSIQPHTFEKKKVIYFEKKKISNKISVIELIKNRFQP